VHPIDTALAAVLRRLRIERGLSQEAVAHQAGVSYTTLAKIELAQSNPGWATVRAIADALGVKLAELAAAVEAQGRPQGLDDQAQKARRR
jgi:transcriptional regulator with XRE-family HTH domain